MVLGGDDLDTIVIIWLDDGRDVEEGVSGITLEADLTKHAWNIDCTLGNRVPIANPSLRKLSITGSMTGDGDRGNGIKWHLRSENDCALSCVLVDEMNRVGSSHRGKSAEKEGG